MLRKLLHLFAILCFVATGAFVGVASGPSRQDKTADWVTIKSTSPSPARALTRGNPIPITVQIDYNLASTDSGILGLYVAQSPSQCGGNDYWLLYPAVDIPIQKGQHEIKTVVTWPGDTGEGSNLCILGNGYVGFVPMLFAEENMVRTRRLNNPTLTGCIPFHASAAQTPTRPLSQNASVDPQVMRPGGTSVVTVVVKSPDGSAMPNARVVLGAGLGTFQDSGSNKVIGHTNDLGRFSSVWKTPPVGARYGPTVGMSACAFKDGFQGVRQGLQVTVRPD